MIPDKPNLDWLLVQRTEYPPKLTDHERGCLLKAASTIGLPIIEGEHKQGLLTSYGVLWNPLYDSAQAFALVVDCQIDIVKRKYQVDSHTQADAIFAELGQIGNVGTPHGSYFNSDLSKGLGYASRYAIVRAIMSYADSLEFIETYLKHSTIKKEATS